MVQYFPVPDTLSDVPERVAIYTRQSRNKKKSIEEQNLECEADVAELGWPIVAKYSDGTSASRYARSARDEWEILLADFNRGLFNVLVLWESSRGERQADLWLALLTGFRKAGVRIRITVAERTFDLKDPGDWKTLASEGIENQHDSDKMSQRISRATRLGARAGKPHGKITYGYRRVYELAGNGTTREFVAQLPDMFKRTTPADVNYTPADVVRSMFTDVLGGASLHGIVRELNASKIPTPALFWKLEGGGGKTTVEDWQDTAWNTSAVRYILLNEAYLGVRKHHRCTRDVDHVCDKQRTIVNDSAWESMIDEEDFWAVHRLLKQPNRTTSTPGVQSKAKYLLSCIAACATSTCGDDMLYLAPQPTMSRPRAYYRCRQSHAAIEVDSLDTYVTGYVTKWLAAPKNWELLRASVAGAQGTVVKAQGELELRQSELEELRSAAAFDPADPDKVRLSAVAFARMEAPLLERIDHLLEQARYTGMPGVFKQFAGLNYEEVLAVWASSAFGLEQKRAMISAVVQIRVSPAGKGRRNVPVKERVTLVDVPYGPGTLGGDNVEQGDSDD